MCSGATFGACLPGARPAQRSAFGHTFPHLGAVLRSRGVFGSARPFAVETGGFELLLIRAHLPHAGNRLPYLRFCKQRLLKQSGRRLTEIRGSLEGVRFDPQASI